MSTRYPIEYDVTPRAIPRGTRWLTVSLKNVGGDDLRDLDVKLHSLDTYAMMVLGTGALIPVLKSDQEETRHFQVSAETTGNLYIACDGIKDDELFHWETPAVSIAVDGQPAELVRLMALNKPYAQLGKSILCEAYVRGLIKTENLVLEFWAETPSGTTESLDKVGLGELEPGEEERYTFEITPQEEGIYILHAYLYQSARRIGHRTEYLSITL